MSGIVRSKLGSKVVNGQVGDFLKRRFSHREHKDLSYGNYTNYFLLYN